MVTIGKNYIFNSDTGKVHDSNHLFGKAPNALVEINSPVRNRELPTHGFTMMEVDFNGVNRMYTMVDLDLAKNMYESRESIIDNENYYLAGMISRVFQDSPIDPILTRVFFDGNNITRYKLFSYLFMKKILGGVNQYLNQQNITYNYILDFYKFEKDENNDYCEEDTEEATTALLEKFKQSEKIQISPEKFIMENNYKYLYILRNREYYFSNNDLDEKYYMGIFIYMPSFGLYQYLTQKEVKRLKKICNLRLEYLKIDDINCHSKEEYLSDYFAEGLVNIIEMVNAISIDIHIKNTLATDKERSIISDIYNYSFMNSPRYDALKITMQFPFYKLDLMLTEKDFLHTHPNDHKKDNQNNYYKSVGNHFEYAYPLYCTCNIWLLKLIIRLTKIRLEETR